MNVVTVALYCPGFVVRLAIASHRPNDLNRHRTAALSAIESDEPTLTAVVAVYIKVALVNHTESGITLLLFENAILQKIISAIY